MEVIWEDIHNLLEKLERLDNINNSFRKRVVRKNLSEMRKRASKPPFTPVDKGQLRLSRKYNISDEIFGYSAEYAPHVEYGHRTQNGGYVKGQHFLKSNLEKQVPIFKNDLILLLKEK